MCVEIWMVSVWQIKDDSPNLPNFLPSKLSRYTVCTQNKRSIDHSPYANSLSNYHDIIRADSNNTTSTEAVYMAMGCNNLTGVVNLNIFLMMFIVLMISC